MLDSLKKKLVKVLRRDVQISKPSAAFDECSENSQSIKNYFKLGSDATKIGDFESAITLYEKAILASPSNPAAHIGLGFSLLQISRFVDAIRVLKIAIALNPNTADGFYMLGKAYIEQGFMELAENAWRKSIVLSQSIENIYCEYCLLLVRKGKFDDAKQLIQLGLEKYPNNPDISFFLGNLNFSIGDFEPSISAYQKSLLVNGDSPYVLSNLGTVLRQVGRLDESIRLTVKALTLAPNASSIFSNYLLGIQYSSNLTKEEKFKAHQEFSLRYESPLVGYWGGYQNILTADRKIKIGYVSGDFRNHSLMFFIEPVLQNHNKSKFEIYCYYSYPVDDEASRRVAALADQWVNCSQMSDDDLARRIRADAIDVLIDLSGHTGNNRLLTFARKPAPIQLTWLGYQATTGLKAMDFRITDDALDPVGTSEAFHTEKLLRLSSSGAFSPSTESSSVNALPALAGNPFTFGCLNNPSKITDEIISLWAKILCVNLGSRLLVGNSTPHFIEEFSHKFLRYGVTGDRLLFFPKVSLKDYLKLHNQIDLALDTFPYNGGTTTFHSLWMGVPIIAKSGDTTLSKVGTSVMGGLGLGEFCSETNEDYVEKALYFSVNLNELSEVRMALRGRMTHLSNHLSKGVTESLESSLQGCWLEYCEKIQQQTATA